MTAPKITGGTITGVALTGNTFTSPVISGGSINNTPIGATTASTGAFSTLSVTGATTFSGATVANTFSSSNATITGGSISGITDLAVADGGTGASTLAANNVLLGNGTSALQTVAPSTAGNVLTSNGTTWASTALSVYPLTNGTSQASTSGTSIDFTSIPTWVKRITVMFNGVSTSGTSNMLIQIGSGSFLTTGYDGSAQNQVASIVLASAVTGFPLSPTTVAGFIYYGTQVLSKFSGNEWSLAGQMIPTSGNINFSTGTNTTLGGVLDRIRITTTNGTDTFDAGSINILYE
jgi:hypothetical protein